MNGKLTGADHGTIARARELAAMSADEIRTCSDHPDSPFSFALGRAQVLLAELASLAERLTTEGT